MRGGNARMRVRGSPHLHALIKEQGGPLLYIRFATPIDDRPLLYTIHQEVSGVPYTSVALWTNARSRLDVKEGRDIVTTIRDTIALPTKHLRATVIETVSTIEGMVWMQPWIGSDSGRMMMKKLPI